MFKKERTAPFTSFDEVFTYHNREIIPCLECGKPLQFLPRHIFFMHGLNAYAYREKWNIPQSISLAGTAYLAKRSQNMKDRIANGRLDPELQVTLMRKARKDRAADPEHGRKTMSELYLRRVRLDIIERKIWHLSPAVKTAPAELKVRAVQRMNSRPESGEQVKDIAADLRVSSSALYRWVREAGKKGIQNA